MINKKFIQELKKEYEKRESERTQIINLSGVALHNSKRIIFALHRGDIQKAGKKLIETEKILQQLEREFGRKRVSEEGSYKAGAEEYVEAKMFYLIIIGEKIDRIEEVNLDPNIYLAGICDLTGELARKAVNEAAGGNLGEVEKMKKAINEIMAELIEFDMVGYLRVKYDQAKNSLRKIEQIDYEIKTRI